VQWTVFEPNDMALWGKLRRNVGAFLTNVWRSGALVGATPQEAFYVRCDETLNSPDVQALGQVIVEIGVAPVRPAEFVIFRISQWAGPAAAA
jgi:phage tail sheath protein FI